MRMTKEDFEAKARQITIEIDAQLTKEIAARGNKHISAKHVRDIFFMAMRYYLEQSYMEGISFARKSSQGLPTQKE